MTFKNQSSPLGRSKTTTSSGRFFFQREPGVAVPTHDGILLPLRRRGCLGTAYDADERTALRAFQTHTGDLHGRLFRVHNH
jgi:hypothetical protein